MSEAVTRRKAELAMIDQIVAGAEQAFLASGYDLATMDSVARHAGVARASVYNNFKGKEDLFLAVMRRGVEAFVARALPKEAVSVSPRARLRRAAITFLRAATETESVEMYRTVVAQAGRFPQLSETLHAQGLQRVEAEFRALAGEAEMADPAAFAEQLLAALMGGAFARRLLGVAGGASAEAEVDKTLAQLLPPVSA